MMLLIKSAIWKVFLSFIIAIAWQYHCAAILQGRSRNNNGYGDLLQQVNGHRVAISGYPCLQANGACNSRMLWRPPLLGERGACAMVGSKATPKAGWMPSISSRVEKISSNVVARRSRKDSQTLEPQMCSTSVVAFLSNASVNCKPLSKIKVNRNIRIPLKLGKDVWEQDDLETTASTAGGPDGGEDQNTSKWMMADKSKKADVDDSTPMNNVKGRRKGSDKAEKSAVGRPKRRYRKPGDTKEEVYDDDDLIKSPEDDTVALSRTLRVRKDGTELKKEVESYEDLYSTMQAWGKSEKKTERDTHKFLKRRLKEIEDRSDESKYVNPAEYYTVEDFLEELDNFDKFWDEETDVPNILARYLRKLKTGELDRAFEATVSKNATTTDLIDKVLRKMEQEEGPGYRYPIAGTPDERYSDPNVYKAWGRTGLHQRQYLKPASHTFGKVEPLKETLEEMILSRSPLKDDMQVKQKLESLRVEKLERDKTNLASLNAASPTDTDGTEQDEISICAPTFTATIDSNDNIIDKDFLSSERQRQLELLLALNPYNPWDEYKRMSTIKTNSNCKQPIPVKYKLKSFNVKINVERLDGNDTKIHRSGDVVDTSKELPNDFIRDYMHYFLMLPDDHAMMQELEKAEYLYDVLKYFDTFERELPEPEPEFRHLQDRLFTILFPSWDGFPKRPPDPAFPMTLQPDKTVTNYRVNAINAMIALLKTQKLAKGYAADIFSEQRVKSILQTIERVLELEIQRLKLGVSDITIQEVDVQFCEVNDAYLATLSATLSLWNLTDGIENIVDALIVLTLAHIKEMRPKYLVATLVNLTNLHKLPKSVFQKFVTTVVQHILEKMSNDLVKTAVDPTHLRWMDFETAAQTLNVMARYKGALSTMYMDTFMQLYMKDFMELKVPHASELTYVGECGLDEEALKGSDEWISVRKPLKVEIAQRQQEDYETECKIRRDMNVVAIKGRVIQYMWSLISCLSWCNLTSKYSNVVEKLNMASHMSDLRLHSMAAVTVLETCSQKTEDERQLVKRAINTLIDIRLTLTDEQWLEAMYVYEAATTPQQPGHSPRIQHDPIFVRSMLNHFVFYRHPSPKMLRKAVDLLQRLSPCLSREQRNELFRQMCENVCHYSYMERQSLNAERLTYPVGEMAHVLRVSAECGFRKDEPWKTFNEVVKIFKHVLTLDDIRETLSAFKASNYQRLDDMCNLLLSRACDVIEVVPDTDARDICDIMELVLALGLSPIKLLRWFLYLHLHHIPERDMDRLAIDLVKGRPEYEIDFRGWKRPVGHKVEDERMEAYWNMFIPVNMDGSKPAIPSDNLKHVMQQHTPEPPPYSGKIRLKEDAKLPDEIVKRITCIVQKMLNNGHELSAADIKLFKMASVMPPKPTTEAETNVSHWSYPDDDAAVDQKN